MTTLVKLQSIETETNTTRLKLGDFVRKLDELDAEIRGFETEISDATGRLDLLKKQYRTHESDAELNLTKVKKSEEKLRAVKNNKEYQSTLKQQVDRLAGKLDEKTDQIEQLLGEIAELRSDLSTAKTTIIHLETLLRNR